MSFYSKKKKKSIKPVYSRYLSNRNIENQPFDKNVFLFAITILYTVFKWKRKKTYFIPSSP